MLDLGEVFSERDVPHIDVIVVPALIFRGLEYIRDVMLTIKLSFLQLQIGNKAHIIFSPSKSTWSRATATRTCASRASGGARVSSAGASPPVSSVVNIFHMIWSCTTSCQVYISPADDGAQHRRPAAAGQRSSGAAGGAERAERAERRRYRVIFSTSSWRSRFLATASC